MSEGARGVADKVTASAREGGSSVAKSIGGWAASASR